MMKTRHVFTFLMLLAFLLITGSSASAMFNLWSPEDGIKIRQGDHIYWVNDGVAQRQDGTSAIVWSAATEQTQNAYIQILDTDGNELLPAGGTQVTNGYWAQNNAFVMPFGEDEWIVAWRDYRHGTDKGDPGNFYMQRVAADGSILWQESGVAAGSERWHASQMHLLPADDGYFYTVWGGFYGGHVQKFDSNGIAQYPEPLVLEFWLLENVLPDDNDGLMLVFKDMASDGVIVHHMLPDGTLEWGEDGVTVVSDPGQYNPRYVSTSDGMGGVFISWCFYSNEGLSDVYAQHMDYEGTLQWEPMTVIAGGADCQHSQKLFPAGPGSMIVIWAFGEDWWDETEARIQRVTSMPGTPSLDWGTDETGVLIAQGVHVQTSKSVMQTDDSGGAWVAWVNTLDYDDYVTSLLHVSNEGTVEWDQGVVNSSMQLCGGMAMLERNDALTLVAREQEPYMLAVKAHNYSKVTGDYQSSTVLVEGFGGDTWDPVISRVDDSAYVGWNDNRPGEQGVLPYLQRVHVLYGTTQWQDHGINLIPGIDPEYDEAKLWSSHVQIVDGGQGSALVSWNMTIDTDQDDTYGCTLQKVSQDGELLWGDLGVEVERADGNQELQIGVEKLVSDQQGGALLFTNLLDVDYNSSLYLQHVDGDGNLLLQGDGIELVVGSGWLTVLDVVQLSDDSSIIIYKIFDPDDGSNIYATKISPEGEMLWDAPVIVHELTSPYWQLRSYQVSLVHDYVMVGVHASDSAYLNRILWVQGISTDGDLLWPDDRMEFEGQNMSIRDLGIAPAGNTTFWLGMRNGSEFEVNKYDQNQSPQFDEPLMLATSEPLFSHPEMISDEFGGFFLVWECGLAWPDSNIRFTHIAADGEPALPEYSYEGVYLTDAPHEQEQLYAVPDGEGGILAVWNDYRGRLGMLEGDDVYAMRINETVSEVDNEGVAQLPQNNLYPVYPNPFNASAQVSFSLAARTDVIVTVFDVLGRHVTTLVKDRLNPGNHSVVWDASTVSSGVYFVRMQTPQAVKTQKAILMK